MVLLHDKALNAQLYDFIAQCIEKKRRFVNEMAQNLVRDPYG